MYKIAVADLQPGMCLGRSVLTVDGAVLLRAGVPLRPSYIEQLRRLAVPAVYVANPLAPDVDPPDVVSDRTRAQLGAGLREINDQIRRGLEGKGRRQERRWAFDLGAVRAGLDAVLDEVLGNPHALVHLRDIRSADDYTLGHSVNVCILAALLGVTQGLAPAKLRELILGAMLHDVGKVCIRPEILQKEGQLNELEMLEMRQHTTRGFEVLRKNPEISLLVAHVAFQHHERWAGGGYPRGLKGNDILGYARIVTVADVYDALVSDRVYRPGLPPRRALNIMVEGSPGFFEPVLVKAFTNHIAVYPVGAIVRLSDGCTGVVVEVRRGQVERPVVRVVKGPDGRVLESPCNLDLSVCTGVFIDELLADEPAVPEPASDEVAEMSI